MFPRLLIVWLVLAAIACASSPHQEAVTFSFTADVGVGNSVFVVGNHPDLGAGDVTRALKLRYTAGNVWTGQIAVQAGTALQYRYLRRSTAQGSWCNAANSADLSGPLTLSVPAQPPAPFPGKTVYYLSAWNSVDFVYNNAGSFTGRTMTKVGPGRVTGESVFKISGVGEPGENVEFTFSDGQGHFDNPPGGGNYLTRLDVLEVQDGNVFSYQPPATISAPRLVAQYVDSTASGIPGRNVRIYLPRGYDQNTARRYPVVYLHDGQNVFDPGGPFGSWSADATATKEIGAGRMRESILVGIDNTAARIPEYQPPNDSYQGTTGRADAYASFVINNVRPYVDTTYRTLNAPANTLTIGSSLGGLVSLYLGREFTVFGKIAVMSPALWISPNYVSQVRAGARKPLRVHLDMGTDEGQSDFDNGLAMYDTHLAQGDAAGGDVEFVVGCGQQHNEAAWAARLPHVFDWLLPAIEDPPELAQRDFPPALAITAVNPAAGSASFEYTSFYGFRYGLERSGNLGAWDAVGSSAVEGLPWSRRTLPDSGFGPGPTFWRLRPAPAP